MVVIQKVPHSVTGASQVVKASFWTVVRDPQILLYPILGAIFVSSTVAIISRTVLARWYNRIFTDTSSIVPHKTAAIIGLVSFAAFYAAFITAYFTVAVSAGVLAKLEGRKTYPLYGLVQALRHFFRVGRFAILSVFLFPVGVYAQRRKLPKGVVGVVGSSITLHMANLAPEILSTHKRFGTTVRDAIKILGKKWQEGLIIKVAMYSIFTAIVILPKLIQHGFNPSAAKVGWVVSVEIGAGGLIIFKTLNAIFTTVLYHQAKHEKT